MFCRSISLVILWLDNTSDAYEKWNVDFLACNMTYVQNLKETNYFYWYINLSSVTNTLLSGTISFQTDT